MDEEHPAEPPDPALLNRQPKWFKPVFYGMIIASFLFALAVLTAPLWLRSSKKSDQTEAVSNARQIGLALFEFETEYGEYPSSTTRPLVEEKYGTAINLSGTSSNALFRQLFAVEITEWERMFYAKIEGCKRPDDSILPGNILETEECGFSYIAGLNYEDNPSSPIVLTPLIPGTTRFDPEPFDGKAIVLFTDNTVRTFDIQKDGHIYHDGIDLLSLKHPVWKGKTPDIRYPE
ncbi:MAG: hypothetical protein AB8D78_05570 [Akkermansiaceae bacterium]